MRITLSNYLTELNACKDSITWATPYETNWEKAWQECQRADWMLWFIGKTINCPPWTDGRKPLLVTCLDIAETNKYLWTEDKKTVIGDAFNTLRQWTLGKASTEEAQKAKIALRDAANASASFYAAAAAYAAYANAAADAADAAYANAAANAAYTAAANANAAADAAYAAYANASYAAYANADAAIRLKKLAEYADIVRSQWCCGEIQVKI